MERTVGTAIGANPHTDVAIRPYLWPIAETRFLIELPLLHSVEDHLPSLWNGGRGTGIRALQTPGTKFLHS